MNKWEKKFKEYIQTNFNPMFEWGGCHDYGYKSDFIKPEWEYLPCVRMHNNAPKKLTAYTFIMISKYDFKKNEDIVELIQLDAKGRRHGLWPEFYTFRIRTRTDFDKHCELLRNVVKSIKEMKNKYKLMTIEEDFV